MKATINGKVIADSDETVYIEGNQYFPPDSVNRDLLTDSTLTTECFWKGTSKYYNVDGVENAAWYYPEPMDGSAEKVKHDFKNYVAFYGDKVQVTN